MGRRVSEDQLVISQQPLWSVENSCSHLFKPIQKNFSTFNYVMAHNSLLFSLVFEFQLGETHCEPLECPPIHCSHPVVPQGHCCPVCPWQNSGHTHHNNTSSVNGVCSFSGMTYLEGEVWKLNTPEVEPLATVCSKCQCKVS